MVRGQSSFHPHNVFDTGNFALRSAVGPVSRGMPKKSRQKPLDKKSSIWFFKKSIF
jgi:hypothetical protein